MKRRKAMNNEPHSGSQPGARSHLTRIRRCAATDRALAVSAAVFARFNLTPSNFAAENPINADRVNGDDRQDNDAAIEEEAQCRCRRRGARNSNGIGNHIYGNRTPRNKTRSATSTTSIAIQKTIGRAKLVFDSYRQIARAARRARTKRFVQYQE